MAERKDRHWTSFILFVTLDHHELQYNYELGRTSLHRCISHNNIPGMLMYIALIYGTELGTSTSELYVEIT